MHFPKVFIAKLVIFLRLFNALKVACFLSEIWV